MGKEFNIRILYFCFVLSLYFFGIYASKFIYITFGIEIELKVIFPILSLLLMDWFFRLTTYHLLHICDKSKRINDNLILDFNVYYSGPHTILIEFIGTKGFDSPDITLSYLEFESDDRKASCPAETFQYLLKPDKPIININIEYKYDDLPKPIFKFRSTRFYFIRNTFRINGYFKKSIRHFITLNEEDHGRTKYQH